MNRQLGIASTIAIVAFAVTLACPARVDDRRAELIEVVVEAQLLPDLRQASERGEALHARVGELCASPGVAPLDAVQDAWSQLRAPWKRLLALPLGPIVDEGFDTAIDFWPARPSSVEGGLSAGVTTQAELDMLGVASKGMPAIEYLVWDPIGGDEAVLAALTGPEGPARCAYVELLAADVSLRLAELEGLWTDHYATELRDAGETQQFPELELAIDALVNAMIAGLHDIDHMKLGKPLGLGTTGPNPEIVESRFSGRSLADARDGLAGFKAAYLGLEPQHVGLTILVAQRSPAVDTEVREAIDAAQQALADVPEPLATALSDDPAAVEQAQLAIKQLRITMTADVASVLGVTVSLSDNDGD